MIGVSLRKMAEELFGAWNPTALLKMYLLSFSRKNVENRHKIHGPVKGYALENTDLQAMPFQVLINSNYTLNIKFQDNLNSHVVGQWMGNLLIFIH